MRRNGGERGQSFLQYFNSRALCRSDSDTSGISLHMNRVYCCSNFGKLRIHGLETTKRYRSLSFITQSRGAMRRRCKTTPQDSIVG